LLLSEIKPSFRSRLDHSLVNKPSELQQFHIRILETLHSGDLALYVLLIHYTIFLCMKVSDVSGAQLSCGGMIMALVAEGKITSWPVKLVQLQSAVVSSATVMLLDLHWAAHRFVSGLVN
jgi:hypothetical protein